MAFSQSITTLYTDIEEMPYKKVVIKGVDTLTTYFDQAGQPIADVCDSAIGKIGSPLEESIRRAFSDTWKKDTTQRERKLQYAFFLSSKGYSNARIIGYDFRFHTTAELQGKLESVLDSLDPRAATDCKQYIELEVRQYISYPIYAEKKLIDYDLPVHTRKEVRVLNRQARKESREYKMR